MSLINEYASLNLLREAEGYDKIQFRQGQWEAIDALINRNEKVLVVQRTGWGKSSVYFLTTRILRAINYGPTLIISPLLSLIRNQIATAKRYGLHAVSINSTNWKKWPQIEKEITDDNVDLILISPERLANEEFNEKILPVISTRIGLFVVDEAHCISDWGHDFRPHYRRLVNVLQQMHDNVRILGTTATANRRVMDDVREQLGFVRVLRGPLIRKTLSLQTLSIPKQESRMAWLAQNINSIPGTGIIYTLTKHDAENLSFWLRQQGICAYAYYSGAKGNDSRTSDQYRKDLEEQLLNNKIKALVATTALGMGFDKPDLGFVIHFQAPGSIITYYQQVGRAGRGIDLAYGILMYGEEDESIHQYFRDNAFPKESWVNTILEALENNDGLSLQELKRKVNLSNQKIQRVLDFLSVQIPSPLIFTDSKWYRTPVLFQMDHAKIRRLTKQRIDEWSEVLTYRKHNNCKMEFLVTALDENHHILCGKCSSCLGRSVIQSAERIDLVTSAKRYLNNPELPLVCNTDIEPEAFPNYGFIKKIPYKLRAKKGKILSSWGDSGWGQTVLRGKQKRWFDDELVDAVVKLYYGWEPQPAPEWLTCIPSHSKPNLVPAFAERLSLKLGLPFKPIINKVKQNHPQKLQESSFYQCKNLDGVFEISVPSPNGPVLLIDDVYDSGWTLTVASALLRRAGSGEVWPLALTTSRTRA